MQTKDRPYTSPRPLIPLKSHRTAHSAMAVGQESRQIADESHTLGSGCDILFLKWMDTPSVVK